MSNNQSGKQVRLVTVCGLSLVLMACGGGGSPPPPPVVTITISPTSASVFAGGTQQFTAFVTGSSNTAVTWNVDGVTGGSSATGTITPGGLYTAPSPVLCPNNNHTVTATSQADTSKSANASVAITPPAGQAVTFISPIVVMRNSPGFALSVNGSGFDSTSQVLFNCSPRPTTLLSQTQLSAQLSSPDLAAPGTFSVTVQQGGQPAGGVGFFVVPTIMPQTVAVSAGAEAAGINIAVPPFTPSLSFIAAGTCGVSICTARATGTQISQGTSLTLFLVGNGFMPGTFYMISGSPSDVTVTQPLAAAFRQTNNGLPSAFVQISVSSSAALGSRNILATNPAGEVSVFPGGLLITQ